VTLTIETRNAIITSTTITGADYGLLSAWLHLDYGGAGQSFGGYSLYNPANIKLSTNQMNYAGHFIWRCMEVAGVSEWSSLVGKAIRVRRDQSGGVFCIGHITKEDWFNPAAEFDRMKASQRPEPVKQTEVA
jgi:hypothetical protein